MMSGPNAPVKDSKENAKTARFRAHAGLVVRLELNRKLFTVKDENSRNEPPEFAITCLYGCPACKTRVLHLKSESNRRGNTQFARADWDSIGTTDNKGYCASILDKARKQAKTSPIEPINNDTVRSYSTEVARATQFNSGEAIIKA